LPLSALMRGMAQRHFEIWTPRDRQACAEILNAVMAHPWAPLSSKPYAGQVLGSQISFWPRRGLMMGPWPLVLVATMTVENSGSRIEGKVRLAIWGVYNALIIVALTAVLALGTLQSGGALGLGLVIVVVFGLVPLCISTFLATRDRRALEAVLAGLLCGSDDCQAASAGGPHSRVEPPR
jgi:hypothetical protein